MTTRGVTVSRRLGATHDIAARMWNGIKAFVGLDEVVDFPTAFTFDQHKAAAAALRKFMDKECTKEPCAVCSKYTIKDHLTSYKLQDVPNIDLLDASLPPTPQLPRVGLTTFTWNGTTYCLQPAACHPDDGVHDCHVDVCKDCHDDLKASRVPSTSLVAFDSGELMRLAL